MINNQSENMVIYFKENYQYYFNVEFLILLFLSFVGAIFVDFLDFLEKPKKIRYVNLYNSRKLMIMEK